jgi:hypothetical protein
MVTRVVTASIEGGDKLAKKVREIALALGRGDVDLSVGFQNGATYPVEDGGLPVSQVAFWNEFGTTKQPPRPFIANMVEDQKPTWATKLGAALKYTGYRVRPALEIMGADIKGHMVESINLLQDPPLAPYTIEKKGFAKPLIDTAVMVRNVTWVVKSGEATK